MDPADFQCVFRHTRFIYHAGFDFHRHPGGGILYGRIQIGIISSLFDGFLRRHSGSRAPDGSLDCHGSGIRSLRDPSPQPDDGGPPLAAISINSGPAIPHAETVRLQRGSGIPLRHWMEGALRVLIARGQRRDQRGNRSVDRKRHRSPRDPDTALSVLYRHWQDHGRGCPRSARSCRS